MRSPLTETIDRVKEMVAHVQNNLSDEEYDLFLDMVAPEPEPEAKPTKKASKKPSKSRKGGCAACDYVKAAEIHLDSNLVGYHVYQPAKSKRASGMAAALNKSLEQQRQAAGTDITPCAFEYRDGMVCRELSDNGIHDSTMSYAGYHEFLPAFTEQPAAVSD